MWESGCGAAVLLDHTLGPIDPSLHTPLNPRLQDGGIYPVSVEAVKGYLEFAKNDGREITSKSG